MASEIYREPVLANFKPPRSERRHKNSKWRENREGQSDAHRLLIKQLPCCVCGKGDCDPHHLKITAERGAGLRATDRWLVPLCRAHHDDVERVGSRNENRWFVTHGIASVIDLAAALWAASPDLERMKLIIEAHRETEK